MNLGRSLELYFVDGRPDGMLTAEVFNWTGHVLLIPRTQIAEGLRLSEAKQTGVYILIGANENGELAYIGEAETLSDRLKDHAKAKDWWDQAVLVTTAGDALHKAHVKYLESRLVELALSAGNTPLENGNSPPRPSLNEAAEANMESFLETLNMVLPAIRVDLFNSSKRPRPNALATRVEAPQFELRTQKGNVHAFAEFRDGEWIMLKGSKVRGEWVGSRDDPRKLWERFGPYYQNSVTPDGVLTEDTAFSSPSAAATMATGRPTNGRVSWKRTGTGQTYADWEASQLEADE